MPKVKDIVEENKDAAELLQKAVEENVCTLDDEFDECLDKLEKRRRGDKD